MRLFIFSLLTTAMFLTGCGNNNGASPAGDRFSALFSGSGPGGTPNVLNGLWGGTDKDDNASYSMRFQFAANQLELANRCEVAGKTMTVGITVPIEVGANQITIKADARDEVADTEHRCSIEVKQNGLFFYVLNGMDMFLVTKDKNYQLTKIRD